MSKYLELFAKAIGMPKPIERSRYELETHQSLLAGDGGREMDSASKEPSEEEEAPTTESETKPLDIHEQYHNDTSKHKGCCGFMECRTTFDKDIYVLSGKDNTYQA